MWNRGGRWNRARRCFRSIRCAPLLALGPFFVGTTGAGHAAESAPSASTLRWTVSALAADTGCVVLDDGEARRLLCAGDRLDPPGARLARVDAHAAVFEIDTGVSAPLSVPIKVGATLDVDALRDRLRRATGAQPGWIEMPPADRDAPHEDRGP